MSERPKLGSCSVTECPWAGYTDTGKCWNHSLGLPLREGDERLYNPGHETPTSFKASLAKIRQTAEQAKAQMLAEYWPGERA